MRWSLVPSLLAASLPLFIACAPPADDDVDDDDGSGVITFAVNGVTYSETFGVRASVQSGGVFFSIGWGSAEGGDLDGDFMGSLTLSEYTGAGSYAPVRRSTIIDSVITIGTDTDPVTYFPLGQGGAEGDGSIEVDTASATAAAGTFAFTGEVADNIGDTTPINGTFDVTFAVPETE